MTTPRATSMDSTVSFRIPFEFFTCSASFHIFIRSDGFVRSRIHFLLSPRNTGSLRKNTRYKALPFYPPETTRDRSRHILSQNIKRKLPGLGNFRERIYRYPYVGIIQIRLSVEGFAFLSACNTSSRLKCGVIIHLPSADCKCYSAKYLHSIVVKTVLHRGASFFAPIIDEGGKS